MLTWTPVDRPSGTGWPGFALNMAAWTILAWQLARRTFAETTFDGRLLPGAVGLILIFIHIYGLGDYPDNIVQAAQFWLIPAALVLIADKARNTPAAPEGECISSARRTGEHKE